MSHNKATAASAAHIVGMGVYCPLGQNCAQLEEAMLSGQDSIAPVEAFDASVFLSKQASAFPKNFKVELEAADWMDRATLFTIAAYNEALKQAGLDLTEVAPERISVCLGSSHAGLVSTEDVAVKAFNGELETVDPKTIAATLVSSSTSVIKRLCGAKGRMLTISSACASSNSAIGVAAELIRTDQADVVVAGGADTVSVSVMAGFNALRALAPEKTAPFSPQIGLSLGEGAGIVVLVSDRLRAQLNLASLAQVLGYGLSGDAHHATSPDQDGAGAENAMRSALKDADVAPTQISYINAHGTGTEANDGAETRALKRMFGSDVPVSSTKSYYGHTLGASGVIETISTLLLARENKLPANLRLEDVRKGCEPLNYVTLADNSGAPQKLLINNFGFGGNNSSLVLEVNGKAASDEVPVYTEDDVVITGIGLHTCIGDAKDASAEHLKSQQCFAELNEETGFTSALSNIPRFTSKELRPFARTARSTKLALLALNDALSDEHDLYAENLRSGIISGVVFGAQKPTEKYLESVFLGNPALANAHFFPMITLNATGGAASLAFQIKGFTTTVSGSASAAAYAADLVKYQRQDRAAVVSCDEITPALEKIYHQAGVVAKAAEKRPGRAQFLGEVGAAITLERRSEVDARGGQVQGKLIGWAVSQDPVDISLQRDGEALTRVLNEALSAASVAADKIHQITLLDQGPGATKTACSKALAKVFSGEPIQIHRPDQVYGYGPSSGPLMALNCAVANTPNGKVSIAAGYDVVGEAFAFVLEGEG
ncbi:beta-ketoacyl-[acyl-carrier-protein] synthase family protein [Pseudovibrio ascidiaceicola]|jgi:3-oxoacyl-[acyl-carrier-protein] synthase II|uniref:beta-ketoacyl-[acyl-carrier-protein] synthase family protein n=1 Tax=Pseudovibrio ascidiaceicola TaxID=285279 RepID=UPI001358700E|nr:beta-ketoacyl-[acyl-carrier-protein] synthase family protein [Pseudovibrio ascidiaceicola]